MSVIAAVNLPDRLVMLEDGRELPITQFYKACRIHDDLGPLTAKDKLVSCCRVDSHEQAEVFVVEFPGTGGAHLIVEMSALSVVQPSQMN